jgi:hypothetical protein
VPVASADGSLRPSRAAGLERVAEAGIVGGVVAGIPMALFVVVASATWLGDGLFTPAYRIATMVETTVLDTSLRAAGAGDPFFLSREAVAFGVAVHCFAAGSLGAIFACLARALRLRGARALAVAGATYALAAAVLIGLAVLPALARPMGLGEPFASLATVVGWPSFLAAHAIYGLALGLWPPLRTALAPPAPGPTTSPEAGV